MEATSWDPSLATGDSSVDHQHQALFALFAELDEAGEARADEATIRAILDRLTEYIAVHFECEQDLMARTGYPESRIVEHRKEHDSLTQRTREMVLDFRTGELSSIQPLAAFLNEWLTHHIRELDFELTSHVLDHEASPHRDSV